MASTSSTPDDSSRMSPTCKFKYTPDSGTFSDEGKKYEKDATAFITLKSLQHMDDFLLISNPRNCAPFDDVILCCKVKNRNVIYLFQMSHKLNPTKLIDKEFTCRILNKKKSKFSLDALYDKYPGGIKEIEKIIPQSYIKGCSYKIIFYTNRPVENNSEIFDLEEQTSLFSTNDGKVYKLNRKYLTKEQDCDKRNFLQSINVYSNQHDVDNSSVLHIKNHFNTEDKIVDAIKLDYFGCIQNWCGIKSEKEGLTKEFTYKLLMYATFKNFSVSLDNYKETEYKKYEEFCQNNKKGQELLELLWESIKNNSLTISMAHAQYILGKTLEDFQKNKTGQELLDYQKIICTEDLKKTNENQLQYFIGCLLGLLPFIIKNFNFTIPKQYLQYFNVVSVEDRDEEPGNLLKIHENALSALKQHIIISGSGQYFKIKDIFDAISNEASISNLLSLIVDSYNNKIQENEIFIDRRINKVLLDSTIFSIEEKTDLVIINTNGFSIEDFFPKYNVNNVPSAKNQNEIEYYLQQQNNTDEPLSNNGSVDYSKFSKYILIDEDIRNIKTKTSLNIHFLKLFRSELDIQIEWMKTIGDIKNIKRCRSKKQCVKQFNGPNNIIQREINQCYVDPDFNYDDYNCNCWVKLEDITSLMQNSFIIITGVPGIGKSTLLKQLSRSASPSNFILFVTLDKHYEYFEENEKKAIKSNAEQHLHYFYKNENAIFKELFKNKQNKNEIFILLDGFDEIAPRFTKIVTKIINELREQNYKIILTTRNVLQNKVEDTFGSFAYSLVPFDRVDVERYTEKYFDKFVNNMSLDKLKFKRIIFEHRKNAVEFFSTPLNIHFVSEIVSKDLQKEYVNSFQLNQLTLYEKYIDHKFQIYIEKINNLNIDKSMILRYHKYYAIKALFNPLPNYEDIKEKLDDKLEEYSFSLHKGGEKVGLLIGDINQIFSHRTIAEYFAAKWLLEVFIPTENTFPLLKGEKEFAESVIKIIVLPKALKHSVYGYDYFNCEYMQQPLEIDCRGYSDSYKKMKFPLIQLFFNLMINQNELHKAAYEGRFEYIKETFNSNIEATGTLNIFDRTLLHTIILNNEIEYDEDEYFKINHNLIEILIILFSNVEGILTQRDASQASAQNYAEQISSYKTPLKIIVYETFVYFNRPFELCEIFNLENLCNCSINQLLNVLKIQNKFYSIFHAAQKGRHSVIRQFLDNGIQMTLRNRNHKHVLHFAAESGEDVLDIIKLFSEREIADIIELMDDSAKILIDYAILNNNIVLINTFSPNKLQSHDGYGLSAFHKAIIFNKIDVVRYFLNKIDINFPCLYGYNAIQYAAICCYEEIFELLLSNGADINSRDKNENSLIHLTISAFYLINHLQIDSSSETISSYNKRFFDFISYLLRKDLDVNSKNQFDLTPLCLAVYHHNKKLIKILIDYLADNECISNNGTNLLHVAASIGDIKCLEQFLLGDIINVQDKNGNTALHYAAHSFENVDFLIRNGADPTITNNKGLTCLHIAVHPEIVHYREKPYATVGSNNIKALELLTNHVDVNVQNKNGETALHYAVYYNCIEMVKYLIEKGANINLANKDDLTPLDFAYCKKHTDIVTYLREKQGKSSWTAHNNSPLTLEDVEEYYRFMLYDFTFLILRNNILREDRLIFYLTNFLQPAKGF